MMLIGEYIAYQQPYVWRLLLRRYLCFVIDWRRVMEEPPKPGLAGMVPEEKVNAV